MNGVEDRFQEFDYEWDQRHYQTEMVHLENIQKVPISMFTATDDMTCPYDTASKYIPMIGSETVRIDVPGETHDYFHEDASSEWFMEQLIAQLQIPEATYKASDSETETQ